MRIDFNNYLLKSVPGVACIKCDAPRKLCRFLDDVCIWHDFKNCLQGDIFNL